MAPAAELDNNSQLSQPSVPPAEMAAAQHPALFLSGDPNTDDEVNGTPYQINTLMQAPVGKSREPFGDLAKTAERLGRESAQVSDPASPQKSDPSKTEEGISEAEEQALIERDLAELPRWQSTITFRSLLCGAVLGAAFSIITLKLGLTTGVIPSLNIAAGLLGFFFITTWEKFLGIFKLSKRPFTPQENTVIQTCVVACYGMAFTGGFTQYLLGMDEQTCYNAGQIPGNEGTNTSACVWPNSTAPPFPADGCCNPDINPDVVQPTLNRTIPYMFAVSVIGVFFLVPLRKLFIIDYALPYPSGTATGLMINSFHTKEGSESARKQLKALGIWFLFSFVFSGWKWVFSSTAGACATLAAAGGFGSFPTISLQALANTWTFDFAQNYVGVGMICPLLVDYSILFGSIISWGIMWPLIRNHEGDWYPAGLGGSNLQGLYGYKVFIPIFIFVTDGLYILVKLCIVSVIAFRSHRKALQAARAQQLDGSGALPAKSGPKIKAGHQLSQLAGESPHLHRLREIVFMGGAIPWWVGVAGYVVMLVVACAVIPQLYSPAKWYFILVLGIMAPFLAFANAFGAGMTDWNMASLYGKLAIFIFASWAGQSGNGVVAGLAVCGVAFASVGSASDLMQDFRTGYLTLSNPRAMFVAQLTGALLGCIITPLCFQLFWTAFDLGAPGSLYLAPFATVYRGMAIIGTTGASALPTHCLQLCWGFVGITIAMNLARDFLPRKFAKWVPLPMAMAIPFYIGAWLGIDMGVGGLVILFWRWANPESCNLLSAAVASGLIAGDGIWTVPSAILAIAGVDPPICMGFDYASSGST